MASTSHVVLAAIVALSYWTSLGAVVLRRLVAPGLVLPLAPIVGWAVHGAIAVPVFFFVPFTTVSIVVVALTSLVVATFAARVGPDARRDPAASRVPVVAFVLAALLACGVAAAILPKVVGDAVVLADPVFDHAKAAIVDDIARLGLPPGNPFFADDGGGGRLAYYYLWHFGAAEVARVIGVTGWEADAAMTFFSAFAALAAMTGVAVRLCGRASAALWVPLFAAASSIRPLAITLLGATAVDAWTEPPSGLSGWLFQSSWVPQHVASAACVLVAVFLITTLTGRREPWRVVVIALLVAAAFESSTWIGGVVFAISTLVVVPTVLWTSERGARGRVLAALAIAGVAAAVVAWPFIRDQLAASASRQGASPIAIDPFPTLGGVVPDGMRGMLDLPAYWLVLLPMELGAVWLVGVAAMRALLRDGRQTRRTVAPLAALAIASLACGGLLASTLAVNNDLAWRAVLLAATVLVPFAAAGVATWVHAKRRLATTVAIVLLALGWPEAVRLVERNVVGVARHGFREFADAPPLWARVREIAGPTERVANNPRSLDRLTPWPVNIGWALLADRRSCYAAWELDQVYTSIPHDRLRAIDERFARVFGGEASTADLDDFATRYNCRVIVVVPDDGAWSRDPFATDARYALADARPGRWRIYRRR